jgi:hypothetical protein
LTDEDRGVTGLGLSWDLNLKAHLSRPPSVPFKGPLSALSTTFSSTRKSLLLLPTLVDRLAVIGQLDATVGSMKHGRRGHTDVELEELGSSGVGTITGVPDAVASDGRSWPRSGLDPPAIPTPHHSARRRGGGGRGPRSRFPVTNPVV